MNKPKKSEIVTAALVAMTSVAAHGQTNAPAPEFSIKNPTSWMTWGGDFRARNEYFNNAQTLSDENPLHEQDYFRFRARIWTSLSPVKDLSLNVRLESEPREWMKPASYTTYAGHSGWDWQYGIIDQLNLQWRNILNQPATLTVGRQDFVLNDNWLTGDPTPYDGSATAFTDMARFSYNLEDQKTTFDVIGILQYARDNVWLPPFDSTGERLLNDQNEKGAIFNVSNKLIKEANFDSYFIYKHDDRVTHDLPPNTRVRGDNADIYTIGSRIYGSVGDHFRYSAEGAYQFGEKQDPALVHDDPSVRTSGYRDISAFGFNSRVVYAFNDGWKNQVGLAYEYLSGDNPKTGKDEMFDVLWGRYPRWNELQNIYSYVLETRVAQIANLQRVGPTWSFSPIKNMDFSANYFALFAAQSEPTRAANLALFSQDGNFRGHSFQTLLRYRFNKYMTGLLQGELMLPGNFYSQRDTMTFARAELNFAF